MPQFDWDCWTDFMYDHHQVTIPKKIVFRLNDEHATVVERETAHARDTLGASVSPPLPQPEHGVTQCAMRAAPSLSASKTGRVFPEALTTNTRLSSVRSSHIRYDA
jgi:hypothetical protein